jgi:calcium-dependent protein kinase
MLTSKLPFEGDENDNNNQNLYNRIKNEDYNKKNLKEVECSAEAKDFIDKSLKKDIKDRLNIQEALDHPWIHKFCHNNLEANYINNDTIKLLLDFGKKTLLQKEIYFYIAKVSNESDIDKFKNFFNQLDIHNMGSLSLEEIKQVFEQNGLGVEESVLEEIFDGLNFHEEERINYSEFLSAMVSSKNFAKEDLLVSVFNLLKENEQNKNYINYDSLINAIKALNLNINEEEIKKCFKEYDNEINYENFKKLILNDDESDKKSYKGELRNSLTNEMKFKRKMNRHKTH